VALVVDESARVRGWLREKKIRRGGTTPAAEKIYSDADLRGPLAIVMGSEQYGPERFLVDGMRPAGADSDGGSGGLTERRDGDDHYAVSSGAGSEAGSGAASGRRIIGETPRPL